MEFTNKFNELLKKRASEGFTMLMCDLDECEPKQKELLKIVLFQDHKSPLNWWNYINFIKNNKLYSTKILQLQRLTNKAISCIDEAKNKDNRYYVGLHLLSVELKNNSQLRRRYLRDIMYNGGIGKKHSNMFLTWCELELSDNDNKAALDVLSKGLACGAEPRHMLITKHQSIKEIETALSSSSSSSSSSNSGSRLGSATKIIPKSQTLTQQESQSQMKNKIKKSETETDGETITLKGWRVGDNNDNKKSINNTNDENTDSNNHTVGEDDHTEGMTVTVKLPTEEIGNIVASLSQSQNRQIIEECGNKPVTPTLGRSRVYKQGRDNEGFYGNFGTIRASISSSDSSSSSRSSSSSSSHTLEYSSDSLSNSVIATPSHEQTNNGNNVSSITSAQRSVRTKRLLDNTTKKTGRLGGAIRVMPTSSSNMDDDDTDDTNPNNINNEEIKNSNENLQSEDRRCTLNRERENEEKEGANHEDDDDNTPDEQDTVPLELSVHRSSDLSVSRLSEMRSSVVSAGNSSTNVDVTNDELYTSHSHHTLTTESSSSLQKPPPSELKKKFLDEQMLNFDPETFRKRRQNSSSKNRDRDSSESSSSNNSHGSNNSRDKTTEVHQINTNSKINDNGGSSSSNSSNSYSVNVHSSKSKRVSFAMPPPLEPEENTFSTLPSVPPVVDISSSTASSSSSSSSSIVLHSVATPKRVISGGSTQLQASVINTALEVASAATSIVASGSLEAVTLNGQSFFKVGVLGKGGSSCVHRVLAADGKNLYAYKRVDVRGGEDPEAVCESYANEIELLKKLKGSERIIQLIDAEVDREKGYVAIVMEVGEIDLAHVLQESRSKAITLAKANGKYNDGDSLPYFNPFFMRLMWQEMLEAVDHIHTHRIVHGDLKPANFVFVKGHLKLIDFGIAKSFSNDTTNIYRDSQIGTVNYMAPETICPFQSPGDSMDGKSKIKIGRASDIWSLGCILYQMLYGRPPFAALNTIQKLQAIPNPNYHVKYPPLPITDSAAIESIQLCLERVPTKRAPIRGNGGLLSHNFLLHPGLLNNTATTTATTSSTENNSNNSIITESPIMNIENVVNNRNSRSKRRPLAPISINEVDIVDSHATHTTDSLNEGKRGSGINTGSGKKSSESSRSRGITGSVSKSSSRGSKRSGSSTSLKKQKNSTAETPTTTITNGDTDVHSLLEQRFKAIKSSLAMDRSFDDLT